MSKKFKQVLFGDVPIGQVFWIESVGKNWPYVKLGPHFSRIGLLNSELGHHRNFSLEQVVLVEMVLDENVMEQPVDE